MLEVRSLEAPVWCRSSYPGHRETLWYGGMEVSTTNEQPKQREVISHEWLIVGMTSPFSSGGMILVVFGQELVVFIGCLRLGPRQF